MFGTYRQMMLHFEVKELWKLERHIGIKECLTYGHKDSCTG
jgi:hypothetical protein